MFMWHREWGYPFQLGYFTEQNFHSSVFDDKTQGIPEHYHMWGTNMVENQLKDAAVITIVSSSGSDTTQTVTIFGDVAGYPDSETINLTGTTSANGSKSFTEVKVGS